MITDYQTASEFKQPKQKTPKTKLPTTKNSKLKRQQQQQQSINDSSSTETETKLGSSSSQLNGSKSSLALSNSVSKAQTSSTEVANDSINDFGIMMMHQNILLQQQEIVNAFWKDQYEEASTLPSVDLKATSLFPVARIKKVMRSADDGAKNMMISSEAPVLLSKAAELFIEELSLRAWVHVEDKKRRTIQRQDVVAATQTSDLYDFLIDIIPRDAELRYRMAAIYEYMAQSYYAQQQQQQQQEKEQGHSQQHNEHQTSQQEHEHQESQEQEYQPFATGGDAQAHAHFSQMYASSQQ